MEGLKTYKQESKTLDFTKLTFDAVDFCSLKGAGQTTETSKADVPGGSIFRTVVNYTDEFGKVVSSNQSSVFVPAAGIDVLEFEGILLNLEDVSTVAIGEDFAGILSFKKIYSLVIGLRSQDSKERHKIIIPMKDKEEAFVAFKKVLSACRNVISVL